MSQSDVYEILKGLGGKASSNDIRDRAREKYPDRTLYQYVGDRLKKLERKKVIRKIPMPGKENYWEIIDPDFKEAHFSI